MAKGIAKIGDILKGINNSVIGAGGINGAGRSNANNMSRIDAGRGDALNEKLFNQLMQFDRVTSGRIQPFVGGRFVLIVGQMPLMMEVLHPAATNYMRVLFTSTIIGVDGFEDNALQVERVQALTEQNSYGVVTKATGATETLTLTFMTIFQGLPIYRYITRWMNYIQNRGSGVSSYPHLTEQATGQALEYHEGHHSMDFMYIVPDPALRYVEEGAFVWSAVPTSNQSSQILNQTWGESSPKQLAIPFKVQVLTGQHQGVNRMLTEALKSWVKNIALDDDQVEIQNIRQI